MEKIEISTPEPERALPVLQDALERQKRLSYLRPANVPILSRTNFRNSRRPSSGIALIWLSDTLLSVPS